MLRHMRNRSAALLILGLFAATWVVSMSACNTVKGAGRDVEAAGQAGQDAINGENQ